MSKATQKEGSPATNLKDSKTTFEAKPLEKKDPWSNWNDEVTGLCYKIFHENKDGKRLLALWEHRFMYEPMGTPEQTNDQIRFFGGRNAMVGQIRKWVEDKMFGVLRSEQKQTVRKRKSA